MPQTYQHSSQETPGYYWRDYTGRLPDDALPGGWTVNRDVTYIGQVFSRSCAGVYPATIYPFQSHVEFPYGGCKRSDGFVQILCSRKPKLFRWITVNSKEFHLQTIGYNVVRGGQESGSWLNIGRICFQGDVIIGKVCSATVGSAKMWFVHNGAEKGAENYELLVFEG